MTSERKGVFSGPENAVWGISAAVLPVVIAALMLSRVQGIEFCCGVGPLVELGLIAFFLKTRS